MPEKVYVSTSEYHSDESFTTTVERAVEMLYRYYYFKDEIDRISPSGLEVEIPDGSISLRGVGVTTLIGVTRDNGLLSLYYHDEERQLFLRAWRDLDGEHGVEELVNKAIVILMGEYTEVVRPDAPLAQINAVSTLGKFVFVPCTPAPHGWQCVSKVYRHGNWDWMLRDVFTEPFTPYIDGNGTAVLGQWEIVPPSKATSIYRSIHGDWWITSERHNTICIGIDGRITSVPF